MAWRQRNGVWRENNNIAQWRICGGVVKAKSSGNNGGIENNAIEEKA
jgi:hypothetical protein